MEQWKVRQMQPEKGQISRKRFLAKGATFTLAAALTGPGLTVLASGCGGGSSQSSNTVKVAYQLYGGFTQAQQWFDKVKKQFEKQNPKAKVDLIAIKASENDYYTKLGLMQRSPDTAPDVLYEDTFLINSDIKAGYLEPLDNYVKNWSDWSQFFDTSKDAAKGQDGKIYGVPIGTDTRALWYNKKILSKAGIKVPWKPQNWDDILSAARKIKSKVKGVTPFNIYSGKPAGEGSTMQGFEMLLYGTKNTLYDQSSNKWVVSSPGFLDSLKFLKTVYGEGLALSPQRALDPNIGTIVPQQLLPAGKLAIDLDGSWQTGTWLKTGTKPWLQWNEVLGVAYMPTQHGQSPGYTSMSGGWALSISSKTANKDLAWKFISLSLNKENSIFYDVAASQIAVRKDVADSSEYQKSNPTIKTFTDLVKYTHYRPAYPVYPQLSNQIQVAMEGVMTGQMKPQAAMGQYASSAKSIVGDSKAVSV